MTGVKPNTSAQDFVPAGKIALVHDWLTGMRGGEIVLEELCRLFPQADLFTLVHVKGSVSALIENRRIFESPIAKTPRGRRSYQNWLPLFPWAIESFDLRGYDLVVSTSSCAAKGVIPAPDAVHVSYIHSPMRYVWDMRSDYLGPGRMNSAGRFIAGWLAHYLRNWDVSSSTRVDKFIANSKHVQSRVKKYYRRDAAVVHPPVDVDKFKLSGKIEDYFLTVSALVPYKRIDLAIDACTKLKQRLIVVGNGSELNRLKQLAGGSVEFAGSLPHDKLSELYGKARALIFPGEEDFGIAPVEAQAAGRPVIAYARGGALETVMGEGENRTGVFFHEQSTEALMQALKDFDADDFDPEIIRRNAERFRREKFIDRMKSLITETWREIRG